MFVRAKAVGRRRYLYLVEGRRDGGKVKQTTLCYLGPLSKLSGRPRGDQEKGRRAAQRELEKVNEEIGRLPLTFEELSEARRAQQPVWSRPQKQIARRRG